MSDHGWKTLSSKYVLENPWYKVRQDQIIRPDGKPGVYNVVESGGSVHIVPVTDEDKILLIRLYRYSIDDYSWEIPAGYIDKTEEPLFSARRELQEETGHTAEEWHDLDIFQLGTGIANIRLNAFVAKKLHQIGGDEQAEEGITNTQAFSTKEVLAMINNGAIVDGPTLATILRAVAAGLIKL